MRRLPWQSCSIGSAGLDVELLHRPVVVPGERPTSRLPSVSSSSDVGCGGVADWRPTGGVKLLNWLVVCVAGLYWTIR